MPPEISLELGEGNALHTKRRFLQLSLVFGMRSYQVSLEENSVKMESHNRAFWKPMRHPRGTGVGGALGWMERSPWHVASLQWPLPLPAAGWLAGWASVGS